ncbi:MAG: hypothetical protein AAGA58_13215 [Verrucomicrobiota bacterium]
MKPQSDLVYRGHPQGSDENGLLWLTDHLENQPLSDEETQLMQDLKEVAEVEENALMKFIERPDMQILARAAASDPEKWRFESDDPSAVLKTPNLTERLYYRGLIGVYLVRNGQLDLGEEFLVGNLNIAEGFLQCRGGSVGYIAGCALVQFSWEDIEDGWALLPLETKARLLPRLLAHDAVIQAACVNAWKWENRWAQSVLKNTAEDNPPKSFRDKFLGFQPNRTRNEVANYWRSVIAHFEEPLDSAPSPLTMIPDTQWDKAKMYLDGNAVGSILQMMLEIKMGNLQGTHGRSIARSRTLACLAALELASRDQRVESLDQLVPEYFPTVPRNPFTGAPLEIADIRPVNPHEQELATSASAN